jgi:ERCC4-type nuclease
MAATKAILTLDAREHGLIRLIPDADVINLDLGDAHISVPDGTVEATEGVTLESHRIEYVIERKSAADFAASIEDGRYREQKSRLLSHYRPDQIMYLVEGYYEWCRTHEDLDRRVSAAIRHCIIRDRIQIYHVPNIEASADFIRRLCSDWAEYRDAERAEYTHIKGGLSSKRRENSTPERVYQAMLTCVGGVSEKTAKAIAERYPNFRRLVEASGRPDGLCDLRVNGRKVSKKIVENLQAIIG